MRCKQKPAEWFPKHQSGHETAATLFPLPQTTFLLVPLPSWSAQGDSGPGAAHRVGVGYSVVGKRHRRSVINLRGMTKTFGSSDSNVRGLRSGHSEMRHLG